MGSPNQTKTWHWSPNQLLATTGTAEGDSKQLLLAIKTVLRDAFPATHWVVKGSSDGSGAGGGMASGDLWTDATKLIGNVDGQNHSWIVLEQALINAHTQLCIDLNWNGGVRLATVVFSPGAGFFDGGTPNKSRPTAADEVVMASQFDYAGQGGNPYTGRLHVMQSTDGACNRVVLYVAGQPQLFWFVEKPGNPISGWGGPVVCGVAQPSAGTSSMRYADWYAAKAWCKGKGPVEFNCYLGCLGAGNQPGGSLVQVANELETPPQDFAFLGIGLMSDTPGARGIAHGVLDDLYFGTVGQDSAGAPDDGSRKWVQMGHVWMPWLGNGTAFETA